MDGELIFVDRSIVEHKLLGLGVSQYERRGAVGEILHLVVCEENKNTVWDRFVFDLKGQSAAFRASECIKALRAHEPASLLPVIKTLLGTVASEFCVGQAGMHFYTPEGEHSTSRDIGLCGSIDLREDGGLDLQAFETPSDLRDVPDQTAFFNATLNADACRAIAAAALAYLLKLEDAR